LNGDGIGFETSNRNRFSNITSTKNEKGLYVYFSQKNIIENNTCENNKQYGIHVYRYADENTFRNNSCKNNSQHGIFLDDLSDGNSIENNTISGNKNGIYLEESCSNTEAHNNTITNNSEYGIDAQNNKFTIIATNNWFGHPSGPYHPVNNSNGKGDNVTDYVEFKPWLKVPVDFVIPTPVIESILPNPALVSDTVVFAGAALDDRTIERYVWRNNSGEMYNGTEPEFSLSNHPPGTYTIYFKVQESDYGAWSEEVSTTLLVHQKPTASITSISPSPAFDTDTVSFSGKASDDGTITTYIWISSLDGKIHNSTEANFTNSSLSVGTHTINFKVQDNYGVWSEPATTTLTVNESIPANKLPIITITGPENGAELKGTVTIKGTASDPDGMVETVDILVDGEWFQATGTTTWEYELDTTKLENWDYVLKVLAFDGTDYSEDALLNITVANEKEDDGGDDGPGFEAAGVVLGIFLAAVWWKRKNRTG